MKQIQPISIWVNGSEKQGSFLSAISEDNLKDSAKFYWQIFEGITNENDELVSGSQLASGNLVMSGADYENWNNDPSINEAAYIWVASQLGLTLI